MHKASDQATQSLYLMTKSQLEKVWQQSVELLQLPEFTNFNASYKNILGCNFFDILPKSHPALAPAFTDLAENILTSSESAGLSQLFFNKNSPAADAIKTVIATTGSTLNPNSNFLKTDIGNKMLESITKPYEETILKNIAKVYDRLLENNSPQQVIDTFCKCHELSIVPENINQGLKQLHATFQNKYIGLGEFNSENQYLAMQMRHIFYPSLQANLNKDYQSIKAINLNGFHHDEYNALEKNKLFTYTDKTYGNAQFGAEECFKTKINFENGITPQKEKTFFPSSWSREKTAQVIFEASQNRVKEIFIPQKNQRKFECKGPRNLIIEVVINIDNIITSAYPSMDNFIGI